MHDDDRIDSRPAGPPTFTAADAARFVERLHRVMAAEQAEQVSVQGIPGRERTGRRRYNRAAGRAWASRAMAALGAVMIVAIGGGVLLRNTEGATSGTSSHSPTAVTVAAEYTTQRGQRATIRLAEGGTVTLGPDSRLHVRGSASGAREVDLVGEAYFTIAHQASTPFVVRAGDGVVRVLGTEFVVRRYPTDSTMAVAVATGRVAVRARSDKESAGIVLDASDAARLGPGNQVLVTRGVSIDDYTGWRTGRLHFNEISLAQLLTELERAYAVDFVVADSALVHPIVSATFNAASVDGMLAVLAALLPNAHVERDGRTVHVRPRH